MSVLLTGDPKCLTFSDKHKTHKGPCLRVSAGFSMSDCECR
jgi:hypothetical protein